VPESDNGLFLFRGIMQEKQIIIKQYKTLSKEEKEKYKTIYKYLCKNENRGRSKQGELEYRDLRIEYFVQYYLLHQYEIENQVLKYNNRYPHTKLTILEKKIIKELLLKKQTPENINQEDL
jgi:hypothetical protein